MFRGMLAVVLGMSFSLLARYARAQDDGSHNEPAMPHAHGAAGHGEHEHGPQVHVHPEFAMEDSDAPSQNMVVWFLSALGWKYALLLPVSALLSFGLTALLVIAGKGRTSGAALGFIVAIPFLIGIFGMFDGMLASFMVIAQVSGSPKPAVIAEGVGTSLVTPMAGMVLMVPSYFVATVGLSLRAFHRDPKS